jgi:iron complex outermembrane receptor protein
LGEVLVEGTRTPAEAAVRDPTASASVIDTRDAPRTVETLTDVLSDSVGTTVRRFGGLGDFSTVAIRGSSSGQVQVYLDGVPLSRADNETVNLADLPLDAIERVEVYRGTTPLRFAQSAPGGIVNVVPRYPGDTPITAASTSFGSFLTRKVDLLRAARVGEWDYLAFGQYLGSRGDFSFPFKATPTNPENTTTLVRENNAFNQGDLTARIGWRPAAPVALSLTTDTFAKSQGVPGKDSIQATDTNLTTVRQLVNLDAKLVPPANLPIDVTANTYVVLRDQDFSDPLGELALQPTDDHQRTTAAGGQILARGALGSHNVPGLLLAMGHERNAEHDPLRDIDVPDRTRLRLTVAGEDEVLAWGDRISLVGGMRWEYLHDDFPGDPTAVPPIAGSGAQDQNLLSPRGGLRVEVVPNVTVLANVGRYQRAPNFQELFGNSGNVVGNPDLVPETALNVDVGGRATLPPLGILTGAALEVAYFNNRIDDLILLVEQSQGVVRPENIGRARVDGIELGARGQLWRRLRLTANWTHQDPRDESDTIYHGNQLPGRPRDEVYARAELGWSPGRPLPIRGLGGLWPGRLWFDANVIAGNYLNKANTEFVAQRVFYGAGVEVVLPIAGIALGFEVRNAGNDQQVDALGYPLPGRSFFGTISWGFAREAF